MTKLCGQCRTPITRIRISAPERETMEAYHAGHPSYVAIVRGLAEAFREAEKEALKGTWLERIHPGAMQRYICLAYRFWLTGTPPTMKEWLEKQGKQLAE